MRVLVVTRDDAAEVEGGDVLSLRHLARHMRDRGIDTTFASGHSLDADIEVDLVHIGQINALTSAERAYGWARRRRIPLAVSPLFEEFLPFWYKQSRDHNKAWRRATRLLGRTMTRHLYTGWHTACRWGRERWRRQRAILLNAHWIPNSDYGRRHLQQWFAIRNPAVSVVPLGIDPGVFRRTQRDSAHVEWLRSLGSFVLQVARIEPRKNQEGLLMAMGDSSVPIVFVGPPSPGDSRYVDRCKSLAQDRGNVHFCGRLSTDDLVATYSVASVHVLPSWSERPGLTTLEAAACGCKIVASTTSSIVDYVGDQAWYCDPDDSVSIRHAVECALAAPRTPDLQARVRREYTWERSADKMVDAYGEAAA